MSSNKAVTCLDINGKEFQVPAEELTFRPATYGVIIKDGKVLLSKQGTGYDFPGGGIEIDETIPQALVREVKEETGFDVKVGPLITCIDSFYKFTHRDKFVHSIMIYHLCWIVSGEICIDGLTDYEKKFVEKPEWIDLNEIKNIKFYNSVTDCQAIIKQAQKLLG